MSNRILLAPLVGETAMLLTKKAVDIDLLGSVDCVFVLLKV